MASVRVRRTSAVVLSAGLLLGLSRPVVSGDTVSVTTSVQHGAIASPEPELKSSTITEGGKDAEILLGAPAPTGADETDYIDSLDGCQHWTHFPVTVAFVHDASDSPVRERNIMNGFKQWVAATAVAKCAQYRPCMVMYAVAVDPGEAEITVRCDPTRSRSETTTSFDTKTGSLHRASVRIGILSPDVPGRECSPEDLQALAAHEFGHAMGLNGHSTNPGDLMYPSLDENRSVTTRDAITLDRGYRAALKA